MHAIIEQLIAADKRFKELDEPMRSPWGYLLFMLVAFGCSNVEAQDSGGEAQWPSFVATATAAALSGATEPTGLTASSGLARPVIARVGENIEPWIHITWDRPADYPAVEHVAVEVFDSAGRSARDTNRTGNGTDVFWVSWDREQDRLNRAGCSFSRAHLTITSDCVERYRGSRDIKSFRNGFLKAGERYEIRLLFAVARPGQQPYFSSKYQMWMLNEDWIYSPVVRETIPTPQVATPTLRAAPTPTPLPPSTDAERIRELERRVSSLECSLHQMERQMRNVSAGVSLDPFWNEGC